jgi:copper chaperone
MLGSRDQRILEVLLAEASEVSSMETRSYTVPGMTCGHCKQAVNEEVSKVSGVAEVDVDLDTKLVLVRGDALDDSALREAIEEAGYEAV